MAEIARILPALPSLRTLDIGHNDIGIEGGMALLEGIREQRTAVIGKEDGAPADAGEEKAAARIQARYRGLKTRAKTKDARDAAYQKRLEREAEEERMKIEAEQAAEEN